MHGALSNDTLRLTGLAGRVLLALQESGPLALPSLARRCGAGSEETAQTLDALVQLDLVVQC